MKNVILFTLFILISHNTFAQKNEDKPLKLSIGLQVAPNEFEFSDKKMTEEEKRFFQTQPPNPEKSVLVFNASATRPLNKNTSVTGSIYISCPIKNDVVTSTYRFSDDPRNYNVSYVIPNPSAGIEGEFDHHYFVDAISSQTTFAFQEIALGLTHKFGKVFEVEGTCGLDHRSQVTEVTRTPTEYVTFYKTQTVLKDNVYQVKPIAIENKSQTVGETFTQDVRTDTFNASFRANAIVNVYRANQDKLVISLQGGAKYLVGRDMNANVGVKVTKKL